MRRKIWPVAGLVLGLLGFGAWAYFRAPDFASLRASDVQSVEVQFERWGENAVAAPGATSEDRDAVAALVAVIRSAETTSDHKCGSRGVITLRQPHRSVRLEFLPGHHADWYEFRSAGSVYRVPRAEFVAAMRRLGVEVPLDCRS